METVKPTEPADFVTRLRGYVKREKKGGFHMQLENIRNLTEIVKALLAIVKMIIEMTIKYYKVYKEK